MLLGAEGLRLQGAPMTGAGLEKAPWPSELMQGGPVSPQEALGLACPGQCPLLKPSVPLREEQEEWGPPVFLCRVQRGRGSCPGTHSQPAPASPPACPGAQALTSAAGSSRALPHRRAQDPVRRLLAQRAAPALPLLLPAVLRGPGLPQQLRVAPLRQPGQQQGALPAARRRARALRRPPQPGPGPPAQPQEALRLRGARPEPRHRPLPGRPERAAGPAGHHGGRLPEPRERL